MEKATFGAGCFWGIEAGFRKVKGVSDVTVGYAGGSTDNPTYEQVCSGMTGHAEVVEVNFDSDQVSFEELLEVFWQIHDPTTLNRQGPNVGYQYRSEIFYNTDEEKLIAEKILKEVNKKLNGKVVTKISKEKNYCKAEEYHQKYFQKKNKK